MPTYPVVPPSVPGVDSPVEDPVARLLRGVARGTVGAGVTRPLRHDGARDYASEGGADLINAAIGQILGTRASWARGVGELPWRPEFGSLLHLLRHSGADETRDEIAKRYVVGALKRWLPRVRVTRVEIRNEKTREEGDTVFAVVHWVLRRTATAVGSDLVFAGTARAPLPLAA